MLLDEAEQNITQEVASIIRRLESHAGRSEQLSNIYNSLPMRKVRLKTQPRVYVNLLIAKALILKNGTAQMQDGFSTALHVISYPAELPKIKNMKLGNRN